MQIHLILLIAATSLILGAWELIVTRVASVFFYFDVAYLILAICLLALGIGALWTRTRNPNPYMLGVAAMIMPVLIWPLLNSSTITWLLCLFALPFVFFGALTAVVWRIVQQRSRRRWLYAIELIATMCGLALLGPLLLADLPINVLGEVGRINHMKQKVLDEGLIHHEHQTSLYARTDVITTERSNIRYVFTDGMYVARAVAWNGKTVSFEDDYIEDLTRLKRFALEAGSTESIALLGAGAGMDIAVALQTGFQKIDAVEVNPATIEVARSVDHWAGGILANPKVSLHNSDARLFVETSNQSWDQINLTLMQTSPAAARARHHVDARMLTREAMRSYLDHLQPDGLLTIIQNRAELANTTAYEAVQVTGDTNNVLVFAIKSQRDHYNPFNHLVVVSASPFTHMQLEKLEQLTNIYQVEQLPLTTTSHLAAVTDNRPYFFESGTSFYLQVLLLLILSAVVIGMLVGAYRKDQRFAVAALLTGAAALAIQFVIMHEVQKVIASPSFAIGIALATVLGGTATGALVLQRAGTNWRTAGLGACIAIILVAFVIPFAISWSPVTTQNYTLPIALFFGCLPLGLPFLALMNSSMGRESLVIGFDGLGGILGASIATTIAIAIGYDALALITLLAYLLFTFL